MSRYYQSSYHGSNDYKKYRQERLKANDSKPQTPFKSSYKQDLTSYKPSSTFNNKEHLQTFGKQDKMLSYGTGLQLGRSADISLKSKYQNYSTQQTSFNGKYESKYEPRERDYTLKSNNYLIDRQTKIIPSYQQTSDLRGIQDQPYQNTSRQRPSSRFSKYEGVFQNTTKDNFEDSVLSRGKDYGYQNVQRNTQMERSSNKNYNYSSKVNNLYQRCQQDKVNEDKNYFTKKQTDFNKKVGQRNYLNTTQYQSKEKIPSYQSRNQLIKQRLNLNSNIQSSSNTLNIKSNFKQPSQQEFDTKVPGFTSRYLSTHNTPQKSHFTPKDDKNLSQQRRKSLIEKSQMLKQKLNKLNTSSSKLKQNQQNQQDPIRPQNPRNQKIPSQGYTPPKKFTSYSLKQNRENEELTERSVSKKLDFDLNARDLQTDKNYDSALKESNRNSTRSYMKIYQNENIEDPTFTKNNLSATKNFSTNQQSGDGALKKIQQLNERINSRLQSILKNYG